MFDDLKFKTLLNNLNRDDNKILEKQNRGSLKDRNTTAPRLLSLVKGVRSDQRGKTKWIMGTGKISWSDKLIVFPFSAVHTAPQQETNKGKPEALHSNTLRRITRQYWFIYIHTRTPHRDIIQMCNHTASIQWPTHTQSHLHLILYVGETKRQYHRGHREGLYYPKKTKKKQSFHFRLSVIVNTIITVTQTLSLKSNIQYSLSSIFRSCLCISSKRLMSIWSPQYR